MSGKEDEKEIKKFLKSMTGAYKIFGDKSLELGISITKPCEMCKTDYQQALIPTYFFYKRPHIAVQVGNNTVVHVVSNSPENKK